MARVALLGVGTMGAGIAANLLRRGHAVCLYDVREEALLPFGRRRGATVAASPAEAARGARVILTAVPGPADVEAVAAGPNGLLAGARRGAIWADLTTSDPTLSRRLAARCRRRGVSFLDAGMSGGAAGARRGDLTLMVGGEEGALRRARPVLRAFSARIFHLGPSGRGHTLKLLHNLLSHITFLAACETLRAGERMGLDLARMVEVVESGTARSFTTEVRFRRCILRGRPFGSTLYNFRKDVSMGVGLLERLGGPANLSRAALGYLERAAAQRGEREDYTHLYGQFERLGGSGAGKAS